MNLSELRTRVTAKLSLDNSAQGEQPLIDLWAFDAVNDILRRTHCTVRWIEMALTAGQYSYELPAAILAIKDVSITGGDASRKLVRLPLDELVRLNMAGGTSPSRFYTMNGLDQLLLYPTPGAGESITVFYVPAPTAATQGTDDFASVSFGGIPVEHQKAIEAYVCREAADYDDDTSSLVGKNYDMQYEKEIRLIKKGIRQMGGNLPARMIVNRSQHRWPTASNSAYP